MQIFGICKTGGETEMIYALTEVIEGICCGHRTVETLLTSERFDAIVSDKDMLVRFDR